MAGLLSGDRNAQDDQNAATVANDNVTAEAAPNVTPEEQAQYDKFVDNGLEIIYPAETEGQPSPAILEGLSGQINPQIAEMMSGAEPPISNNPIDNLASTAVSVVLMLEASAAQSNAQISDDVIFHGGREILEECGNVSDAAGIHDYSEQELESSFYRALDIYRVSSPRIDPETLSQEFGAIEQADKSGQLGQLLPGIEGNQAIQGAV